MPSCPIILVGIKHCGKSTQGRLIAKRLGLEFFDTDDLIQHITGKSPRDIYTKEGKEAFLEAEKTAVLSIPKDLCVIATGGGICDNSEAVATLKNLGTIVFLEAKEKTAADRIVREASFTKDENGKQIIKNLPAYIAKDCPINESQVRALFHEFYTARTEKYKKIAGITIQMEEAGKTENMEMILKALNL